MKKIVHVLEYSEELNYGGSCKYAHLLDKGLNLLGYKTIKIYRPSLKFEPLNRTPSEAFYLAAKNLIKLLKLIFYSHLRNDYASYTWITHHPVLGFLSLFSKRSNFIYICHGPWALETYDLMKDYYGKNSNIFLILYVKLILSIKRNIQRILIIKSNNIYFLSKYMKSTVISDLNLDKSDRILNKIQLISPIVEENTNSIKTDIPILRVPNSFYICRRLVKRTGVSDFLNKIIECKNFKPYILTIVGTGPQSEEIRRLTKHKSISEFTYYEGFIPTDLHNKNFQKFDYMILPSLCFEGFGLVIIEAISYGCIPIVSKYAEGGAEWLNCTCKELVYDGSIESLMEVVTWVRNQGRDNIISNLKNEIASMYPKQVALLLKQHLLS
tara:strand:- start:1453 stop:2601 length:1149 start_codon:yes stop_codon:yes gene_type:complete